MKNILKALAKVQAEMPTVRQDGANPFHKSKYATLAECWNTAVPILGENGLCLTHEIRVGTINEATGETSDDIMLTHLWHSESGESLSTEHRLLLRDKSPQSYGSAITYARRYSLQLLIAMVSGDEDDDGENAQSSFRKRRSTHEGMRPPPVSDPKRPEAPPESSGSGNNVKPPEPEAPAASANTHNWVLHLQRSNSLCRDLGIPRWITMNPVRQDVVTKSFRKWYGTVENKDRPAQEVIDSYWNHVEETIKAGTLPDNPKLEALLRNLKSE
jgi:hypothetical protein